MYRKFDLMTNTNPALRDIFTSPPIATNVSANTATHNLFDHALNLVQLDNWRVTIPTILDLTRPLDESTIYDISRQNRTNIYGTQTNDMFSPTAHKKSLIQLALLHNPAPIAKSFLNFVRLGLFSQAIWLFAAKITLEQCLGEIYEDKYGTGNSDDYQSFLSITIVDSNCIEITYINSLCCVEPISQSDSGFLDEAPLKAIFSGVFLQKVQFSICPTFVSLAKALLGYQQSQLTLQAKIIEASYYLQSTLTGITPESLGFGEVPVAAEMSYSVLFPPVFRTPLVSEYGTPAGTAIPTPRATPAVSPLSPRKQFSNVTTPPRRSASVTASPQRSPGQNPFLKPPT